jgi:hypothetical protein
MCGLLMEPDSMGFRKNIGFFLLVANALDPFFRGALGLVGLILLCGCGMTRMTDTQRTATEQLLISNAIDQAVSDIDFSPLAGKAVYLDTQYLAGTVDKGYVVSSLRQCLLANRCVLREEPAEASYIVEARAGCIGTDRHGLLVGIPQMSVPALVPGQPSQIPEIPVAKRTDEQGCAKLALFAYNRLTGKRIWQSGVIEATSDARDMWVLGLGPFRKGTILQGTELAGEELPNPLGADHAGSFGPGSTTKSANWSEADSTRPGVSSLWDSLASSPLGDLWRAGGANDGASSKPRPPGRAAKDDDKAINNEGGQAATEPTNVLQSGLHLKGEAD